MVLMPLHDLTDRILRCAVAVHRELGPGLPEHSYQTALGLEMTAQEISFTSERTFAVHYRGVVVGWHRPDFVVEQSVVVEVKATDGAHPAYAKQVLTYLKVANLKVGLLLNFNVPSMANGGIRRFVL
jgi:GxxExxY protein